MVKWTLDAQRHEAKIPISSLRVQLFSQSESSRNLESFPVSSLSARTMGGPCRQAETHAFSWKVILSGLLSHWVAFRVWLRSHTAWISILAPPFNQLCDLWEVTYPLYVLDSTSVSCGFVIEVWFIMQRYYSSVSSLLRNIYVFLNINIIKPVRCSYKKCFIKTKNLKQTSEISEPGRGRTFSSLASVELWSDSGLYGQRGRKILGCGARRTWLSFCHSCLWVFLTLPGPICPSVNWFRSHRILWGFHGMRFANYPVVSSTWRPFLSLLSSLEQTIGNQSNNPFIQGENSLPTYLFKDLALSLSWKVSWCHGGCGLSLLSVVFLEGREEWLQYVFIYQRPL